MELSLGDVTSKATLFAGRSDLSTSEASFYANLALTEIQSRLHYKPKEAMAYSNIDGDGDERYVTLPTDFDGAIGAKFYSTSTTSTGGQVINVLGEETELFAVDNTVLDSFSSVSGTPLRYAIYGNNIELDPIPDSRGSLVMRYMAKQETLVNLSETPELDDRWHPAWLYKTQALVCQSRGDVVGMSTAEAKYVNYMISTPNDRQQKQEDKHGMGLWVRKQ